MDCNLFYLSNEASSEKTIDIIRFTLSKDFEFDKYQRYDRKPERAFR
jgi:hypothetical protein